MSLRLLTYNIRKGGRGREQDLAAVINAVQPDLVVLQEASRPQVVAALGEATGLPYWGSRRRESLGYLSRDPLDHVEWHHPRLSRHAFLELAPAGQNVRVFGVHLSAVHAAWTERRRALELRALLASVARHQDGFHILTGDFNTLAPGELLDLRKLPFRLKPFVWLSGGQVRWRTIQLVLDAGYVDGYRRHHPGYAGHTFPTWDPHVRLDYVFLPAAHADRLRDCRIVKDPPAPEASDHFPLLADIEI